MSLTRLGVRRKLERIQGYNQREAAHPEDQNLYRNSSILLYGYLSLSAYGEGNPGAPGNLQLWDRKMLKMSEFWSRTVAGANLLDYCSTFCFKFEQMVQLYRDAVVYRWIGRLTGSRLLRESS